MTRDCNGVATSKHVVLILASVAGFAVIVESILIATGGLIGYSDHYDVVLSADGFGAVFRLSVAASYLSIFALVGTLTWVAFQPAVGRWALAVVVAIHGLVALFQGVVVMMPIEGLFYQVRFLATGALLAVCFAIRLSPSEQDLDQAT